LKSDRKQHATEAGKAIKAALNDNNLQGAWDQLKVWYHQASNWPYKPSHKDLCAIMTEHIDLHTQQASPGALILVLVEAANVLDEIPLDEEIWEAVHHWGKAPGPSGIWTNHLKEWLAEAEKEEEPDSTKWDHLVTLIQHVYETRVLLATLPWAIVVHLPKASSGYRGIGLLEVIWKVTSSIIDARMKASITFHDALHGFQAK